MSNKSVKTGGSNAVVVGRVGKKSKFPELPPKYSSSRELRNKAEKMRRDRLNGLMDDMKSLVPVICTKKNKADKTRATVLRITANYLRLSHLFPKTTEEFLLTNETLQNKSLVGEEMPHLQSLDGFFFMLSGEGKILFLSENVEKYLGFSQIDLLGLQIGEILHPADKSKFFSYTSSQKMSAVTTTSHSSSSPYSSSSVNSPASTTTSSKHESGPRRSFYVRLQEKPASKGDRVQYEHMHVVGHSRADKNIFVGVMRPVRDRPITELSLIEAIQDQYITRHLPDGRIIYSDHRISTIAGYLPSEVTGHSAFNFFYAEDLPWTTMAMRHMFASSSGEGSTVYRLFTNSGELICLQTKGFLEYNRSKNKIESFLCINSVIKPEDQEKYLGEQKEKFTPFITELNNEEKQRKISNESSKVSVIAKVSSMGVSPLKSRDDPISASSRETSNCVLSCWETKDTSSTRTSKLGKRKLDVEYLVDAKAAKTSQYLSMREEPSYRYRDGMRVVDVDLDNNIQEIDNIDPSLPLNENLNFTDIIDNINNAASTATQFNQNSVIKKIHSTQPAAPAVSGLGMKNNYHQHQTSHNQHPDNVQDFPQEMEFDFEQFLQDNGFNSNERRSLPQH